jgi:hypothetical protein
MSTNEQNMKTGADALGTAEIEYGHAKHENGSRRPRYRRKWDLTPSVTGTQNMKTRIDALGTAENESGTVKHENGT